MPRKIKTAMDWLKNEHKSFELKYQDIDDLFGLDPDEMKAPIPKKTSEDQPNEEIKRIIIAKRMRKRVKTKIKEITKIYPTMRFAYDYRPNSLIKKQLTDFVGIMENIKGLIDTFDSYTYYFIVNNMEKTNKNFFKNRDSGRWYRSLSENVYDLAEAVVDDFNVISKKRNLTTPKGQPTNKAKKNLINKLSGLWDRYNMFFWDSDISNKNILRAKKSKREFIRLILKKMGISITKNELYNIKLYKEKCITKKILLSNAELKEKWDWLEP